MICFSLKLFIICGCKYRFGVLQRRRGGREGGGGGDDGGAGVVDLQQKSFKVTNKEPVSLSHYFHYSSIFFTQTC